MFYNAIDRITEADLQSLIAEGRREDIQLEFKSSLPAANDDGKREFLKDVSAMANSQGGDIIYGIREDRSDPDGAGKAAELVPISGASADSSKLWMFELLNSSIEPRLVGVVIRDIALSTEGFALIIRVPRSWNSPHVVRHRNHWRFYARNSAGVYAMDVSELRNAFLLSDTLAERLSVFRRERFDQLIQARPDLTKDRDWLDHKPSSTELQRQSLLVTHLQPFDSAREGNVVDVAQGLTVDPQLLQLCSDPYGDPGIRLNFDGLLVKQDTNFIQVYRTGNLEEVDTGELSSDIDGNRYDVECIGATELDRAIFKSVGRRLGLLKNLGVTSPVLVSIALLQVRGCKLLIRTPFYVGESMDMNFRLSPHAIDKHNLFLTGLVIEDLQGLALESYREDQFGRREYDYWLTVQSLLRPYCDSIWNAVGFERSEYFDPDGKWLGHIYRHR